MTNAEQKNVFTDASRTIEERLEWLLSELTMDEKLRFMAGRVPDIERLGIKGMCVGGEAAHGVEARNDQNDLGEPEPTTSLPQPIGMSATWNRNLIKKAGEVTGTEARVLYHRHPDRGLSRWAPTIDLARDPRWGRTEECYGEDPVLTGAMSSAYIKGMQGEHPHYLRIAATLKHFYANNTEVGRGWKNSTVDPRNKYELYLEPFRRAIEDGGAEAVMTAYNRINGIPGMLNPEVQKILKDQYGLKHAVCDGGAMELVVALHHYYGIHAQTIAAAVKAGVDSMSDNPEVVEQAAREAYELGLLTQEDIDRAIGNMLRTKLKLGIYDYDSANPYDNVTEADVNSEAHREICKQVSRESVVLLKNEGHVLPLKSTLDASELAVVGPLADEWYQDWYGGKPYYKTTLRQGMEEIKGAKIACADGFDKVVFRCGDKGLAVDEQERLVLSDKPDVFVKQDWGAGSLAFRCVRTGRFLSIAMPTRPGQKVEMGAVLANKEEPFSWFVTEIFHMKELGDGKVQLSNRFHMPVELSDDGFFTSMKGGEAATLTMEVVEDGVKAVLDAVDGKKQVIVALGCNSMINAKEEVDRQTIELPPVQKKLLDAVCEKNPNVVVVLFSNYPYAMGEVHAKVPAILWSATGSQDMGTAMAETIFGQNAPAGRLNMTWYAADDELPDIDDYDIIKGKRTYRYFDGEVVYPFGYGLTYSSFEYGNLFVKSEDQAFLRVEFDVTNTGAAVSDEVVQVYGIAPSSRVQKPLRQLLSFERVKDLAPGESRRICMNIPVEELRFYDVISRRLVVEEGEYVIYAGASSRDMALSSKLWIPGSKIGMRDAGQRTPADHYDDYENICLTEGTLGFSAAAPVEKEKESTLVYRDFDRTDWNEKWKSIHLFLKSENGCDVEVYADDCPVGQWQGETRTYENNSRPTFPDPVMLRDKEERMAAMQPIYADVVIPLKELAPAKEKNVTLKLKLSGDFKLCYFKLAGEERGGW